VFGAPIQPPPLSDASEASYQQLTDELKSRVVAMWEELRDKNLGAHDEKPGQSAHAKAEP
jgi:hypothetical protein